MVREGDRAPRLNAFNGRPQSHFHDLIKAQFQQFDKQYLLIRERESAVRHSEGTTLSAWGAEQSFSTFLPFLRLPLEEGSQMRGSTHARPGG